jgi:hypothetical protein
MEGKIKKYDDTNLIVRKPLRKISVPGKTGHAQVWWPVTS